MNQDLLNAQENVKQLQEIISAKDDEITNLKQSIDFHMSEAKIAKENYNNLKNEYDSLHESYSSLTSTFVDAKNQVQSLIQENRSLSTQIEISKFEYKEFKERVLNEDKENKKRLDELVNEYENKLESQSREWESNFKDLESEKDKIIESLCQQLRNTTIEKEKEVEKRERIEEKLNSKNSKVVSLTNQTNDLLKIVEIKDKNVEKLKQQLSSENIEKFKYQISSTGSDFKVSKTQNILNPSRELASSTVISKTLGLKSQKSSPTRSAITSTNPNNSSLMKSNPRNFSYNESALKSKIIYTEKLNKLEKMANDLLRLDDEEDKDHFYYGN